MRTCPDCHSLVSIPLDTCPARRESCPLLGASDDDEASEAVTEPELDLGAIDPHRTARIEKGDIEAALAASGARRRGGDDPESTATAPRPAEPPTTRPTEVRPTPGPAPRNRAALLANRLAYWSVLPIFPIGFAAATLALIGLSRGSRFPAGSGTEKAWAGLATGLVFGSAWLVVTLWLLAEAL